MFQIEIEDIRVREYNLKLKEPLHVAFGVIDKAKNVLIEIKTDTGRTGYGEATSIPMVTGDNQEGIISTIENYIKPLLLGEDPRKIGKLLNRINNAIVYNTGAKTGVDIALHDLLGKIYKTPLYNYFGGSSNNYESDRTIGINEITKMSREAKSFITKGYSTLKLKVGIDVKKDFKIVENVRKVVGDNVKIRLDANQGWKPKEAVRIIKKLDTYDIELVEQPISREDIAGLAFVKDHVDVPIMADESIFSPGDALKLIKNEAVDLINIKLMKSGGLYNAKRICDIAEIAGIECMIGCMMESRLAITAAAHLAAGCKNITKVDLDSPLYLVNDPVTGGVIPGGGKVYVPQKDGLGIEKIDL